MKEFDLFIPLYYNDGAPIESRKLKRLQRALLDQFDGLTFFPQPNEGFWKMGDVIYHDEIVVYRVLTENVGPARAFFRRLIAKLCQDLRQEEILVIEREVKRLS